MVEEFLPTLYKLCSLEYTDRAIDELWDVISDLAKEKRFSEINKFISIVDLSKITTGVSYSIIHIISYYYKVLPNYDDFYIRVRQDFARRNKSEQEIEKSFAKFKSGRNWGDVYDPEKPEQANVHPYERYENELDEKIELAKASGDAKTVDYLTWYKSVDMSRKSREEEFRQLNIELGDEELRKRTIQSLRGVADLLEKSTGSWPGIYYCKLSKWAKSRDKDRDIMDSIEVVLSYPWGG